MKNNNASFPVVVMPIYEDVEASSRLFVELSKQFERDVYIVAVDDGSVREPVRPESISAAGLSGVVVRLKRNVGHQKAIATGISYVAHNFPLSKCVVMDADGEDVPKTIPVLLAALSSSEVDVVVAQRKDRVETVRFKVFYFVYKRFFRVMTGRSISFGNFMALSPAAVKRISVMQELGYHVAACVMISRLRVALTPIRRGARYSGKSKMNFQGLVLHGFQAFMVFAEFVLVRVGIACAAIASISVLGIVASILLKSFGLATPGWFSTALGLLFVVLSQTGILTLMTLLLTGIARGGIVVADSYLNLIDEVAEANPVFGKTPTTIGPSDVA